MGILPFLRPGQYPCKIDLKSAYFHMGIHPRDRPYLGVYVDGEFYRWCILPFGLNVAPREWQRLMQPILNAVRERGALVWVYLDDWLIIGNTYRECLEHTRFLVQLLHRLGILVNVPKSCLEPSQEIIMLGFMANSLKPVCFLCFLLFWCPLLPFIETGTLKIYTKMVLYMKNEIFDLKYPLHGV